MKRCSLLAVLVIGLLANTALGQNEINRYVNGTSGIKCGTVPPPGNYWLAYNFFYSADQLNDTQGNPVTTPGGDPLKFELLAYATAHRFLFVTDKEIFGANYAWNFVVPYVYTDVSLGAFGVRDADFVLGDINMEPFVLEWHKPQYDFGFVYGFYAPTADRSVQRPAHPGANYWSHYAGLAGTYYFDQARTWTASVLSRYEVHTQREDLDLRAGDNFSFEFGFAKNFKQSIDIGVSGYAGWQITEDRGTAVVNGGFKDRAFAIGPEIQYFSVKHLIGFHLRHWWDVDNLDRPEGQITTFTIVKPL